MDTKLKNYNKGSKQWWLNLFCWLMTVVCGAVTGLLAAFAVALANLQPVTDGHDVMSREEAVATLKNSFPVWQVRITDENTGMDLTADMMIWTVVAALCFFMFLCVILYFTGQFEKDEYGKIPLNLMDKIWTELQLTIFATAAFLAIRVGILIIFMIPGEDWFGVYKPLVTWTRLYGIDNRKMIALIMAAMAILIFLAVLMFVSMVKKIKAKKFWKTSLIGMLFLAVGFWIEGLTGVKRNERKTVVIYMTLLVVMVLLAMTWVGAVIDIILLAIIVPKKMKKFTAIQEGVEQVKAGNLDYKIPVEMAENGPRSDMDRLALDINEISRAAGVAVQNEIKNQRMKTDLISNVSHDLKTPLTSIISYIDLMKKEGPEGERNAEYLGILEEKAQRLKVLTEDLFEAAKASSGNIPVNMEEIDLEAIITQSLGEMEERLSTNQLNIIVKNQCGTTKVMADGQLLWRVVENLLGNVSKYALSGSRVYINMEEPTEPLKNEAGKGYTLLEIKNVSGEALNISAEELMERFKRGDESRNTEGSGLGLAITKDLCKVMGGDFGIIVDGDLFKAKVLLETAK